MVGLRSLKPPIVVRFHDSQPNRPVTELAYVLVLETRFCGFESHLGDQNFNIREWASLEWPLVLETRDRRFKSFFPDQVCSLLA